MQPSRRRQTGSLRERGNPAEGGSTRGGSVGSRERGGARGSPRVSHLARARVHVTGLGRLLVACWGPKGRVRPGEHRRPVGPAPADLEGR